MITIVGSIVVLVLAARAQLFLKEREAFEKKIREKAREVEQKIRSENKDQRRIESKKPMEVRIAAFLRKSEGVRFTEEELRGRIIRDHRDRVNFYLALMAVTYYQRRNGYGMEADYSKSKNGVMLYYYEKPKE
ncbi:MAG: hypothetical protein WC788_07310 [Candidatus Paceibacterota bacterium]